MKRFRIGVDGTAKAYREHIVEAENEEEAMEIIFKFFENNEYYELDFNWKLPNRVYDVDTYEVKEITDEK